MLIARRGEAVLQRIPLALEHRTAQLQCALALECRGQARATALRIRIVAREVRIGLRRFLDQTRNPLRDLLSL